MPVSDICNSNVVTVVPEATLQEAADIMDSRSIGCLIVTDGSETPVGIITDRDIVIKAAAKDLRMSEVAVGLIMSRNLVSISESAGVDEAIRLMRKKAVRRLIILNQDGKPCGVLSTDDLVRLVGSEINSIGELFYEQDGSVERHRTHEFTQMA